MGGGACSCGCGVSLHRCVRLWCLYDTSGSGEWGQRGLVVAPLAVVVLLTQRSGVVGAGGCACGGRTLLRV